MKIKNRNSSIELLKIIAVILIIISHAVIGGGYSGSNIYIDINVASNDINNILLQLLKYFGSLGNIIFVISSCYFLQDAYKCKYKKIISIVLDSTIISFGLVIIFVFFLGYSDAFSKIELLKMIFPVIFNQYWYITAYVLFCLFIPLIASFLSKCNKKIHFCYFLFFAVLLSINTIKGGLLYFNELIGFFGIFFIISYMKRYHKELESNIKLNLLLVFVSILVLILSVVLLNIVGTKIPLLINKMLTFNRFFNPIIIVFGYSLFNLANSVKFYSKSINYISSLSLIVYIITGHPFIQYYNRAKYYDYVVINYGLNNIVLYTIILSFLLVIGGYIASFLYSILKREVININNSIYSKWKK